jgi:hypothetical protein
MFVPQNVVDDMVRFFGLLTPAKDYKSAFANRGTPEKRHRDTTRGARKRARHAAFIERSKNPDPVAPHYLHRAARERALASSA